MKANEQPVAEQASAEDRPQPQPRNTFECRNLSVELRSSGGLACICRSIDFEVREGEFVSIMGRSGSGKTTLLRILGGLLSPTPGSTVRYYSEQVDGPPRA